MIKNGDLTITGWIPSTLLKNRTELVLLESKLNTYHIMEKRSTKIDCTDSVSEYIGKADWRIKANANTGYSSAGLINNLAGKVIANYWLDEIYSEEEGNAHRNGDYHIHDLDILGAYCCGHDLQKLLQEGFNGVISRVGSKPPKHFREALYQMANYLGILQAEWAGAQAFSSFDTLLAPYVFYDMHIDGLTERDIKKAIRNFVYNLNVPSRWGQSPFTNVTIDWTVPQVLKNLVPMYGDKPYFVEVWEGGIKEEYEKNKQYSTMFGPGDNRPGEFINIIRERLNDYDSDEEMLMYGITYNMFQKEMDIINRCFYQVLSEGDKDGQPFTFPIPTINITEEFDWDNPNCYWLFENTAKYGHSYFQNFIGSQYLRDENGELTIKDPNAYSPNDVRSMCPLTFDTEILVRSQWYAGYQQIGHIYNSSQKRNTKYECFYNGQWIPCNAIKVPNQTVYELTLSNNTSYKMGAYHLQPVYREGKRIEISVKDIKPGDYIPFNSSIVDSEFTKSSYDLGYAVGAYLGDGCGKDSIVYSLDAREKDDETVHKLQKFWEGIGLSTSITINGNLRSLKVNAERAYEIIKPFITGSNALNKGISNIINTQSVDMRQGLIDGYIATDGNRSRHRISTSSKQMVSDLIALFNSLGIKAYCFYTDVRDNRLGENPNYVVAYILNKDNYAKKYHTIDGEVYWEVTDIKEVPYKGQLYCLETESDHHLFTLKDGLITHNCRLQLDKKALRKRGGGLFGSDSQTGSVGVVTINMARLGYLYKGDTDGLMKRLTELCDMAASTLEKKRAKVIELNEMGLFPFTRRYINTFDTFFSTIGVNGMNEMVRNFTNDEYDITDKRGQKMCLDILKYINDLLLGYQEKYDNLYNLEGTPAEGTTYRLAKADKQRYGQKTKAYIECNIHGRIDVDASNDSEYIECPICREEGNMKKYKIKEEIIPGIIQAGCEEAPYYTNSSQLPVDYSADPFDVLDLQDELQKKYTGGTVLHLYMNERVSSPEVCKQLVKKVLSNYRLPYISVTPSFSICPKHGYISGDHEFCPLCDKEVMAKHAEEVDPNK